MERELLLLGLLQLHEMYGYQLNEVIETHFGTTLDLKKPTVYKLLNKMQAEGLLHFKEEQEGNRPTRRIYMITSAGTSLFQQLLREAVVEHKFLNLLNHIALAFLDNLPPDEVPDLLRSRQAIIQTILSTLDNSEPHIGSMQYIVELQKRYLVVEIELISEILENIESST